MANNMLVSAADITIYVKGSDGQEAMCFKIKLNTQLRKMIDLFCSTRGVEKDSMVFLFDGTRITGSETPDDLEMEDGDEIDVMLHQTGGSAACIRMCGGGVRGW